jgi:hypothetical protein
MKRDPSFLSRLHATLLSGLYRWPREHFQVFVAADDGSAPVGIRAPLFSYYADPFVRRVNGIPWLLLEEFSFLHNRAWLVALPLTAKLQPAGRARRITLAEEGYASFPCVFDHEDDLWLIPETAAARRVDLYRCLEFPHRWKRERTLLTHIDAADTVPLWHDGRCWLITSARTSPRDGGHRSLAIFHGNELRSDRWTPHPINTAGIYADSPFSAGRNAGAILPFGEIGLRPVQSSRHYYGESLEWRTLDRLTPNEFSERPGDGPPVIGAKRQLGWHHFSMHDGLMAWDVRDRVSYAQHVPWLRKSTRRAAG